jgi:hypothetical protein
MQQAIETAIIATLKKAASLGYQSYSSDALHQSLITIIPKDKFINITRQLMADGKIKSVGGKLSLTITEANHVQR